MYRRLWLAAEVSPLQNWPLALMYHRLWLVAEVSPLQNWPPALMYRRLWLAAEVLQAVFPSDHGMMPTAKLPANSDVSQAVIGCCGKPLSKLPASPDVSQVVVGC